MKAVIILAVLAVFVAAAEARCRTRTGMKETGYAEMRKGYTCTCMSTGKFSCIRRRTLDEGEGCNVGGYNYPVGQFELDNNACECEEGGKFSCEPAALVEADDSEANDQLSKRLMEALEGLGGLGK